MYEKPVSTYNITCFVVLKKVLLPFILILILCFSGCGKKIDYTGYYNYVGENNGYSEYRVGIHITQDDNDIYTISIKDGDYATDVTGPGSNYVFGNKYHGSIIYDGKFKQGKTYSFIADPTDYPDIDVPYDGDIMVDLQFNDNQLLYKNSKSLRITDKEEFENCDFLICEKVVVD